MNEVLAAERVKDMREHAAALRLAKKVRRPRRSRSAARAAHMASTQRRAGTAHVRSA